MMYFRNLSLRLLVAFWALSPIVSFAQSDQEKELTVNAQFYHLTLDIDLDKPYIKGNLSAVFLCTKEGTTEFELDLTSALKVSKVEGAQKFEQRGDRLWIKSTMPLANQEKFTLKIFYEGEPPVRNVNGVERGMIYKKHGTGETVIATAAYPQYGHLWFPCVQRVIDKVDSIYLDVSIPERKTEVEVMNPKTKEAQKQSIPYTVVSNGVLEKSEKTSEGKKLFQWRHRYRIAPQHVLIAVSNFAKISTDFREGGYKMPMDFYVLPEKYEEANAMVNRLPEIMACLTGTFGDYPFRNERFCVTQVGFPLGAGGGLPTQTNVLMESLKSTQIADLVHLTANMWFGNHISPFAPSDAWITEGLASYAEAMWQEYKRGLRAVDITMTEKKEYFGPGKLSDISSENYNLELLSRRGAYVIHMLRGLMGDGYFFETLKGITSLRKMRGEHSKTYITTKDFQRICQYYASENEEQDYTYFFEQWVRGEYLPTYWVQYQMGKKNELTVKVHQEHRQTQPHLFKMPVKLRITLADGTVKMEEILQEKAEQHYKFNYGQAVTNVEFDPMGWVFKNLRYTHGILNTKTPIVNFEINSEDNGRRIDLRFNSPKKQDISVELIELDPDGKLMEPKVQAFPATVGDFKQSIKIPLDKKSRGIYILRVVGKSDVFVKELRLNRVEDLF